SARSTRRGTASSRARWASPTCPTSPRRTSPSSSLRSCGISCRGPRRHRKRSPRPTRRRPPEVSLKLYEAAITRSLVVAGEPLELTYAHLPSLVKGSSRHFLLLHGNPSHLGSWHLTVPALQQLGDVCAIDMPGFGRSQTPKDRVL